MSFTIVTLVSSRSPNPVGSQDYTVALGDLKDARQCYDGVKAAPDSEFEGGSYSIPVQPVTVLTHHTAPELRSIPWFAGPLTEHGTTSPVSFFSGPLRRIGQRFSSVLESAELCIKPAVSIISVGSGRSSR